jgi:hypothetical protein
MKARLLACAAVGLACAFPVAAGAQVSGADAPQPYGAGAPPPSPHASGPYAHGFAGTVPPEQIAANVRALGWQPLSRPVLRGPVYFMRAANRRNFELRVAIDARSGRIISATRLAFDPPRPTSGYATGPAPGPRYEPYVRGGGYSEEAPLPPGDVPVDGRPMPPDSRPMPSSGRAAGYASPPPGRKVAAQPPLPRARPGESAEVTGSVPEAPAAKPAENAPSAPNPVAEKPTMVPIAPLE